MSKKECIAMLLAGGQGSRLGVLTKDIAKPAVSFGGKYRIIDFALSNCANSGIDTVGVLTQYRPYLLHSYLGSGAAWNLDESDGGISILPPYATQTGGAWYAGTADAVTQNIGFIEQNDPDFVLILSGDQLYNMDYQKMLENHKRHADLQATLRGVEYVGYCPIGKLTPEGDYNAETDVQLYSGEGDLLMRNDAGKSFALFYPEDGHQPYVTLGDPAPIKKVVVRIRTDMLAGGRAS